MPQSLHQKYGHLIFSTKNREPLITGEIESRLFEYMGGTGSLPECLIRPSRRIPFQAADKILIGDRFGFPDQQMNMIHCSVDLENGCIHSPNNIRGQKEHQKTETFQDEFRRFLKQYQVDYDERYLWD